MLDSGADPGEIRKAEKAAGTEGTFKAMALEWHAKQSSKWDAGVDPFSWTPTLL